MTENGFYRTDGAIKCVRCHTEYPIGTTAGFASGLSATDIDGQAWCAQMRIDNGCLYCGPNAAGRTFVKRDRPLATGGYYAIDYEDRLTVTGERGDYYLLAPHRCLAADCGSFGDPGHDKDWLHACYRPETKAEADAAECDAVVEQAQCNHVLYDDACTAMRPLSREDEEAVYEKYGQHWGTIMPLYRPGVIDGFRTDGRHSLADRLLYNWHQQEDAERSSRPSSAHAERLRAGVEEMDRRLAGQRRPGIACQPDYPDWTESDS